MGKFDGFEVGDVLEADCGSQRYPWWRGEFVVDRDDEGMFVPDADGDRWREDIADRSSVTFVLKKKAPPSGNSKTLTLNGKTYTLIPKTGHQEIEIDGVVYEMTEVK